ncbi:hypothetical protein [Pseudarthrobacter sp. YAF2]|uniref:hypothetical protein n=1 Tax=Pseudarthrobacter sp. YAF2 TaxID=3233078 RepID=UPI003F9584C2
MTNYHLPTDGMVGQEPVGSLPAAEQGAVGVVTAEQIEASSRLVDLPLSAEDSARIAELLSQWIPAAIALSTRMQAPELDNTIPITVFGMPGGTWATSSASEEVVA